MNAQSTWSENDSVAFLEGVHYELLQVFQQSEVYYQSTIPGEGCLQGGHCPCKNLFLPAITSVGCVKENLIIQKYKKIAHIIQYYVLILLINSIVNYTER